MIQHSWFLWKPYRPIYGLHVRTEAPGIPGASAS